MKKKKAHMSFISFHFQSSLQTWLLTKHYGFTKSFFHIRKAKNPKWLHYKHIHSISKTETVAQLDLSYFHPGKKKKKYFIVASLAMSLDLNLYVCFQISFFPQATWTMEGWSRTSSLNEGSPKRGKVGNQVSLLHPLFFTGETMPVK